MGLLSALLVSIAVVVWLSTPSGARLRTITDSPTGHGRRHRTRSRRRRHIDRTMLVGQAPVVAELLSTAIAAGATVPEALRVVANAVDDPIRSRLVGVTTAVDLGADPPAAWSSWLDDPALSQIAQAIIRSHLSGSPLSVVLDAAAVDMRRAYRDDVETRARAAGVRAVAPLALCYLPAYLLVGVVPVVAGFANTMFG